MDPEATLRTILTSEDPDEILAAQRALTLWLEADGFEPTWPDGYGITERTPPTYPRFLVTTPRGPMGAGRRSHAAIDLVQHIAADRLACRL